MISKIESGNSKSTKGQEKLGLIIISAQHMRYRTGDSFKGRNKEQETRCRKGIMSRRRSTIHESRWGRRHVQGKGNEEQETRSRKKEEEKSCRKGITNRR